MVEMRGGCHCESIGYVFSWPLPGTFPVRICKCSFCTLHQAAYAAHPRASLAIAVRDTNVLTSYRFATRTAKMNFCARCGVFVYASSVVDDREYALLNITTLREAIRPTESIALSTAGETIEERLARHRRTWIGSVTLRVAGVEPCPPGERHLGTEKVALVGSGSPNSLAAANDQPAVTRALRG